MSKAGVSMMTELYATRLARENIFVYEVRPGIIQTRITAGVKDRYDAICASDELLVKRWGMPEDVAEAVTLFCTNDLRYCTGQAITIDGGFHIRRL
jgi:NAD(P)-dependent dehydrogenase (short-subunit alcohol dehydrogenase family)